MKNWLTFLVFVAFIRLQFVCCCGSVEHGNLESQLSVGQAVCCPAEMKCQCESSHHHSKPESTKQSEAKSACGCQSCNQDHSHLPHLAAEHLRIVPSPNVNFASLVVQHWLPFAVVASSNYRHSRSCWLSEKCLYNGISILCKFGHLRI